MKYNKLKKLVAFSVLEYLKPNIIIGVGSGSTVNYFIEALASMKYKIMGAVSSSNITTKKLQYLGINVFNLNKINKLSIYIDSADEINAQLEMIKGGGGALTREKIIAEVAEKFICIVDESKQVKTLGSFPLPIEIIPMAKKLITKKILELGGQAKHRKNMLTDNGNIILDVYNLKIYDPVILEKTISLLPGVITVGLFALRCADIALISTNMGIKKITK